MQWRASSSRRTWARPQRCVAGGQPPAPQPPPQPLPLDAQAARLPLSQPPLHPRQALFAALLRIGRAALPDIQRAAALPAKDLRTSLLVLLQARSAAPRSPRAPRPPRPAATPRAASACCRTRMAHAGAAGPQQPAHTLGWTACPRLHQGNPHITCTAPTTPLKENMEAPTHLTRPQRCTPSGAPQHDLARAYLQPEERLVTGVRPAHYLYEPRLDWALQLLRCAGGGVSAVGARVAGDGGGGRRRLPANTGPCLRPPPAALRCRRGRPAGCQRPSAGSRGPRACTPPPVLTNPGIQTRPNALEHVRTHLLPPGGLLSWGSLRRSWSSTRRGWSRRLSWRARC